MNEIEKNGSKFETGQYFAAANACKAVVDQIAANSTVGMNEAHGQALIKAEFQKIGITKFWHPSKFRIASETTKSFRELPNQETKLSNGDIFYIDVGPIIQEHEADYGKTFIFQEALQPVDHKIRSLSKDSIHVWNETAKAWKNDNLSGKKLYHYADACAKSLGYRLNPMMGGHRLGDFPHALFHKGHLSAVEFTPSANLWVLEIHLIHDELQRGAFFEDILTK